jgi:uncharacterized protein with FMN-binding domain
MKKILAVVVIILALGGFYMYYRMSNTPSTPTAVTPSGSSVGSETTNPSPTASGSTPPPTTTPAPTPTTATSGYKDGSYTGSVADAFYGKVQVKVTIKNGIMTDVAFLQYPDSAGHSIQVSQQVMPILSGEAIKVQSANVDAISGATQTVEAFQQSLGNALVQAKA